MITHTGGSGTFTLPPSGRLLLPFVKEAAIESLPVFCSNHLQATVASYLTRFLLEDYHLAIRASPSTQQTGPSNVILSNQTFEDQLSISAGSFLTMIAGHTDQTDAAFRVKWYDAGAGEYSMDDYCHSATITGQFTQLPRTGTGQLTTVGQDKNLFILPSPLAITHPGQLNISIVNLSANTATIDMAFFFASPNGHMDIVTAAAVTNSVKR